jgi:superfamily I DNA and/or RNA helicase
MQILSVIPDMVKALNDELEIIKARKIGKNVNIYNGLKQQSTDPELILYTFELIEEKKLYEDSLIKLHYNNQTIEGTILSTEALYVTLSLITDPGELIQEAILEEDITALYIKMIERLEYIKDNSKQFFLHQSESLFFPTAIKKTKNNRFKTDFPVVPNDAQQNALNNSLSYPVSCIWGPPGTGKTRTLAMLVAELLESKKTVLIVAHANRAVDNALYATIKLLSDLGINQTELQSKLTRYNISLLSNISDIDLKPYSFFHQIEYLRKNISHTKSINKALLARYESLQKALSKVVERAPLLFQAEQINSELKIVDLNIKKYTDLSSKNKLKVLVKGHQLATLEKHRQNLVITQQELIDKVKHIDVILSAANALDMEADQIKKQLKNQQDIIDQSGGIDYLKDSTKSDAKVNVEQILQSKKVIFTTLTKLATDEAFKKLRFSTVIIDEASMAPLPLVAVAASLAQESVVIAGDPQQLPPISLADTPPAKQWLARDIFAQNSSATDIDQLFDWQRNNAYTTFLDTQYRMPQTLSNLVSKYFYQNKIVNANTIQVQNSVQVIDTSQLSPVCELDPRPPSKSRYNLTHVSIIKHLLQDLSYSYSSLDIGVITPYRIQLNFIRKMLKENKISGVEAGTIHTFQGREKKVIIFDTTDSQPLYPGILLNEKSQRGGSDALKVLTVAFSRAQEKIIVIANVAYLKQALPGRKLTQILSEFSSSTIKAQ